MDDLLDEMENIEIKPVLPIEQVELRVLEELNSQVIRW